MPTPMIPHDDTLLAVMQQISVHYRQPADIKRTSATLRHKLILSEPSKCAPVLVVYYYNKNLDTIREVCADVPVELIPKGTLAVYNELLERIACQLEIHYDAEFQRGDHAYLRAGTVRPIRRRFLNSVGEWRYEPDGVGKFMGSLFLEKVKSTSAN